MLHGAIAPNQIGRPRRQIGLEWPARLSSFLEINRFYRYVLFLPDGPASEQTVAAAGCRLQHSAIRTERLANGRNVNLNRVLLDDPAPDAPHQVILADELAGRLNQNADDFKRAVADRNRHAIRPEFALAEVYLPLPGHI